MPAGEALEVEQQSSDADEVISDDDDFTVLPARKDVVEANEDEDDCRPKPAAKPTVSLDASEDEDWDDCRPNTWTTLAVADVNDDNNEDGCRPKPAAKPTVAETNDDDDEDGCRPNRAEHTDPNDDIPSGTGTGNRLFAQTGYTELSSCVDVLLGELRDAPSNQQLIAKKLNVLSKALSLEQAQSFFSFRDGPVVEAAVIGATLVMEDYGLPSASTMERLNMLFDLNRELRLQEDLENGAARSVEVHPDFAAVGLVHGESLASVSPATLSRFTAIYCPAYTSHDLELIARSKLRNVPEVAVTLFCLLLELATKSDPLLASVRAVLRWAAYVAPGDPSKAELRVVDYACLVFLQALTTEARSAVYDLWKPRIAQKLLLGEPVPPTAEKVHFRTLLTKVGNPPALHF